MTDCSSRLQEKQRSFLRNLWAVESRSGPLWAVESNEREKRPLVTDELVEFEK